MVEFVEINGASLAYKLVGHAEAPLFITLHGGRGFGERPMTSSRVFLLKNDSR